MVSKVTGKTVQTRFPKPASVGKPMVNLRHGFRTDRTGSHPTCLFAGDETSPFQNTEMFGESGQGHIEGMRQFADRCRPGEQALDDGQARCVTQSLELCR